MQQNVAEPKCASANNLSGAPVGNYQLTGLTASEQVSRAIAHAAEAFGVQVAEITGPRRTKQVCAARHAVAALCRQNIRVRDRRNGMDRVIAMTVEDIGAALGGRDHTTIMNSLVRAASLQAYDPAFAAAYGRMERAFLAEMGEGL